MPRPSSLPLTLPMLRALAGLPPTEVSRATFDATGRGFDRRTLLRAGGALAGLVALGRSPVARALGVPVPAPSPFTLGVASGDPTESSVVLWTRLAPDPLVGGGMDPAPVTVKWEVARDPAMLSVVRSGDEIALPSEAHTVHATVEGLESDRWYWYRFIADGVTSPIGRTRTFPAPDSLPSRLRFALVSCQDWQSGQFAVYHDITLQDIDCVVHVGDYIYEGGINTNAIRRHNSAEIQSLADYRNRHALYKTDPWLQEAHALFPFITTWDDHEVDNNYADEIQEAGQPRDVFLARRAAAYQAYYEHMPLARATKPDGPDMQLYRSLAFGRLARLNMLDTRQYRTDQPCGDSIQSPCPQVFSPSATLTGGEQERWLLKHLLLSRTRWNVIAQQVMMAEMDFTKGFGSPVLNMDGWDGYNAARRRILLSIARYRIPNTIVLTGDIHSAWAADLKPDFADPLSPVVASEFVGTSVTSGFAVDLIHFIDLALPQNTQIKFFEGRKRGYVLFDVTPDLWQGQYRAVESVTDALSPASTLKTFVVQHGVAGLQPG
jgi:alkaline phosphatase D